MKPLSNIRCAMCNRPLKHPHVWQGANFGSTCVKKVAKRENGLQSFFVQATELIETEESITNEEPVVEPVADEWYVQRWEDYKKKYGLVEIEN
jgi:hypothetical protein